MVGLGRGFGFQTLAGRDACRSHFGARQPIFAHDKRTAFACLSLLLRPPDALATNGTVSKAFNVRRHVSHDALDKRALVGFLAVMVASRLCARPGDPDDLPGRHAFKHIDVDRACRNGRFQINDAPIMLISTHNTKYICTFTIELRAWAKLDIRIQFISLNIKYRI